MYSYLRFSIAGPLFLTLLLLFGSGIPTTEKSTDQRFWDREDYQHYKKITSVLIPFPPALLPRLLKPFICCELPLYNYPPSSKSTKKLEDEEQVKSKPTKKEDDHPKTSSSSSHSSTSTEE